MPQARESKVLMGSHIRDEGELCFIQEGGTAQLSRGRRPQGEWGLRRLTRILLPKANPVPDCLGKIFKKEILRFSFCKTHSVFRRIQ